MDQTSPTASQLSLRRQKSVDVVVVLAMGLVALALSLAVNVHFGLPAARAVIAGILIFALLVGAHFLIVPRTRQADAAAELEDEDLWRALKQQRSNVPDAPRAALDGDEAQADAVDLKPAVAPKAGSARKPSIRSRVPRPQSSPKTSGTPVDPALGAGQSAANPASDQGAPPTAPVAGSSTADASASSAGQTTSGDTQSKIETYWSYRPSNDGDEPQHAEQSASSGVAAAPGHPPPAHAEPHTTAADAANPSSRNPRESDVELVQNMIKKLAHEVNAAEVLSRASGSNQQAPPPPATNTAEVASTGSSAAGDAPVPEPPAIDPVSDNARPSDVAPPVSSSASVDMIEASLGALRTTAHVMREADEAAPEGAPQVDQPLHRAPKRGARDVAAELSAAVSAGQLGVLLEPVLNLSGMRPEHYEVSVRINAPSGAQLEAQDVEQEFEGTGFLSLLDLQRFQRALHVSERLSERGKSGALFTQIYRESLLDRDFCFAVASTGVANAAIAQRLVLSLSQASVHALSASEWQTLHEFHELGYRFAMTDVTDLNVDFARLAAAGFRFVRLSADLFDDGAAHDAQAVAARDICGALSGFGLVTVVDGLDDSETVARVVALGANLGQGQLSGGPRLMKSDAVGASGHAAA